MRIINTSKEIYFFQNYKKKNDEKNEYNEFFNYRFSS